MAKILISVNINNCPDNDHADGKRALSTHDDGKCWFYCIFRQLKAILNIYIPKAA